MAIITKFQAGYCTHPSCVAVKGSGFASCKFPARVFLIQANDRYWLWDTGYSHHFYDATQKGIFALYRKVTPVYFNNSESIISQLKENGFVYKDIQGVILSHFHGDHIAGVKDFPSSQFICSGEGWNKLKPAKGFNALLKGFVPDLLPKDFEQRTVFIESFPQIQLPDILKPFTTGYCLPNSNKEIILVELPGHAAGHLGAFIYTEQGWVLIASDACWSSKNYRELFLPSKIANIIMDSSKQFLNTVNKLHQLDKNNIKIYLTHEEDE